MSWCSCRRVLRGDHIVIGSGVGQAGVGVAQTGQIGCNGGVRAAAGGGASDGITGCASEASQLKVTCELAVPAVRPVGVAGGTPFTNPTVKDSFVPTEVLLAISGLARCLGW